MLVDSVDLVDPHFSEDYWDDLRSPIIRQKVVSEVESAWKTTMPYKEDKKRTTRKYDKPGQPMKKRLNLFLFHSINKRRLDICIKTL